METEYEAKVLDVNVDEIISKLDVLGAKRVGDKLQKRYVYDFNPKKENSWIRLRTNGTLTTLAIKEIKDDSIEGIKELEVSVSSFEDTSLLLEKLGYKPRGYQENRRISYLLDDVEVEIDFWPRIPPYIEVEAKSSEKVEEVIKKLGFEVSESTSMNTTKVYKKYGIDISSIESLKFED